MIPLSRPTYGKKEAEAVAEVLDSAWVSQGPMVQQFENHFSKFVNAPHAVAVSSCTAALHLALLDLGVGAGDEVILPSHTFIATANAVRYCGATPVFVDIDPLTFNINPELVPPAVTPQTRAILAVHQLGMPCDLNALSSIARDHGLHLVEDAACAIGSEVRRGNEWVQIGEPIGDVACFSFHGRKLISTGEGGMLTTRSTEAAANLRLLRHHGMSVPDTVRHKSLSAGQESYDLVGYNYRLSDIQAAVGVVQLRRVPGFVARRREIAAQYAEQLRDVPGIEVPKDPSWARSNWQSYCVRLPETANQREVVGKLRTAGVGAKGGVMCIHKEPAYTRAQESWRAGSDLMESERAMHGTILLPMFDGLTDADIGVVVCELTNILAD